MALRDRMYIDTQNALLFVLLVAAVSVTWYVGRGSAIPVPSAGSDPTLPLGYYLRDAILYGTDADGRIFYEIHAGEVSQASRDDSLNLHAVRVDYRDGENVSWQVSAASGSAPADRSFLDLRGGVRLASERRRDAPATVIETEGLRLEPDQHLASTALPVRVALGDDRLDATGLKAYLKDDRLELESEVHGQFRN